MTKRDWLWVLFWLGFLTSGLTWIAGCIVYIYSEEQKTFGLLLFGFF